MAKSLVANSLWSSVQERLRGVFPAELYQTWFASLRQLPSADTVLVLGAANDFQVIWVQDNYLDVLRDHAREVSGREIEVSIRSVEPVEAVDEQQAQNHPRGRGASRLPATRGRTGGGPLDAAALEAGEGKRSDSKVNAATLSLSPRNTFENFVVGPSNQMASAAALAVANNPATAYNPLFIYGDTGLGKTHLMQAVAHFRLRQKPSAKIVYLSCEKFTNDYIQALQENSVTQFRKRYRSVDILLIDDVQFLANKERIQEEFFHTFNELHEAGRQICLTSDRPASEISKLEARLISRFQWGMVTDIQIPDLETRVAILAKKARAQNLNIPENILEFMAQRITRNVRRMEGALTRVASYMQVVRQPLDVASVERLLADILQEEAQKQITIEHIQRRVVEFFNLRQADMVSKRRPANIAFPRQVAMYLSRMMTNHALQEIGDCFGGRDHGTVIHACKTVENLMETDESIRRNVEYLTKQLSVSNHTSK